MKKEVLLNKSVEGSIYTQIDGLLENSGQAMIWGTTLNQFAIIFGKERVPF